MTESMVVHECYAFAARMVAGVDVSTTTERLVEAATQWARECVPIDTINRAIHDGVKVSLDSVGSGNDVRIVMTVLDRMTSVVSDAYVRELRTIVGEQRDSIHDLTAALLAGHPTSTMARECGIDIAESYVLLALSIPQHSDERDPALDPLVATRRKLRRIHAELTDRGGDTVLALLHSDGGTALLPANEPPTIPPEDLVAGLSAAAQVPITATLVTATPQELPTAATRAHELLDVVRRVERAPGLYRFDDLVLEYQFTRPGPGREYLGSLLDVLDNHPELLETLQRHVANDLNRQRTAHSLHVHTNTVDYRLRRISHLTGFDPTRTSDLWYLRSALLARSYRTG